MKTVEKYECEICRAIYSDKEICLECEKSHSKPVSVTAMEYTPRSSMEHYNDGFPIKVKVTFENGVAIGYRRM